jgi:acyl-CoA reductase-like NAD-dependent aldehyde dehydrogenase
VRRSITNGCVGIRGADGYSVTRGTPTTSPAAPRRQPSRIRNVHLLSEEAFDVLHAKPTLPKSTTPPIERIDGPFINGQRVTSLSEDRMEVINPSNGWVCLLLPVACDADVDLAVKASRVAFETGRWSEAPPSFRKNVLHRFSDLIASEAAHLDALDAGEMGKPISTAFCNAASAASLMRFYAEAVDKLTGDVYASDVDTLVLQRRVPRGVVAAVSPWNFPTYVAALKIAPALAAGNCVVLKPSELSSRSALRLAELAVQAGLPPGVLNVVPGAGHIVGRALGLHMDVDMVTFTGSTEVGKLMMQYSGQSNMKPVLAECGGKSPHIVFDDGVDLDAVADSIARVLLTNQGQICSLGSRLLVQRTIESDMVNRIRARLTKITMGDALDPRTTFGPLASKAQCERVMRYIDSAEAEGAALVMGGRRALSDSGGFFVEPTLFRSVPPTARIAREEIFGPVLSTIAFEDEDDAIRIANDVVYGLSAYVWSAKLSTGLKVGKAVRSSVVVNAVAPKSEGAGHAASYEPRGQSGVGVEGGLAGMESYQRRQRIRINHS